MNYDAALNYIHGTEKFGSKLGLDNIKKLLELLGNPQNQYEYIHIGGTNGKGSVAAILSNILREEGYRVGTFISPYLEEFTERIQVDLDKIPKSELAHLTHIVKEKVELMVAMGHSHPTEFEIVTAIGLLYFAKKKVRVAVVEVGLGGRLDATNIVDKPLLSIVTSIGFDHMDILGRTLGDIAYEKAGIIKANRPIISYPQLEEAAQVIRGVAKEKNAPLYEVSADQISSGELSIDGSSFNFEYEANEYKNLKLHLIGEHQLLNAATALTAVEVLKGQGFNISEKAIYSGVSNARWAGRLEIIRKDPLIILDGAHNAGGAGALANAITTLMAEKKLTLILGMLRDKEVNAVISRLCPLAHRVIVTKPNNPRALDTRDLAEKVKGCCHHVYIKANPKEAIDEGLELAKDKEVLLICGSLYLVGEARAYLH